MKQPVDHVLRPQLPWRVAIGITECGLDGSKVGVLSREQFFQRVKDMGSQRAAMVTCMTCSSTVSRYKTWEEDPRSALGREIDWEGDGRWHKDRGTLLRDELVAIAALIAAHPEEFAATIAENAARQEWLEKKKALAKRPPPSPPPPFGGGL